MLFKNILFTTAFAVLAAASPLVPRDSWNPRIISPNEDTKWVKGERVNVTWDTSDAPPRISPFTSVVLNKGNVPTQLPALVENFDLSKGWVELTVPCVEPADDYSITLFGSSDNRSPQFTIKDAPEA